MEIIKLGGIKIMIEIDATAYIVPVPCQKLDEKMAHHRRIYEELRREAELNGCSFDYNSKRIHMWWVNPKYSPSNFQFGELIFRDDQQHIWHTTINRESFPAVIFEGKKEGDVVDYKMELGCWNYNRTQTQSRQKEILFHLTLDQLGSRFADYGPFEKVFNKVIEEEYE